MDDALEAYDEALVSEDTSRLNDNLLRVIALAVTDSDLSITPVSDKSRVNGAAFNFDVSGIQAL